MEHDSAFGTKQQYATCLMRRERGGIHCSTVHQSLPPITSSTVANAPLSKPYGNRADNIAPTITAGMDPTNKFPSSPKLTFPINRCPAPANMASGMA